MFGTTDKDFNYQKLVLVTQVTADTLTPSLVIWLKSEILIALHFFDQNYG